MENQAVQTHLPCSDCGSHDALSIYSDGHTYCFSCNTTHRSNEETNKEDNKLIKTVYPSPLPKRGITQATTERYYYYKSSYGGKPVQVANYFDKEGKLCGQKLRFSDKTFCTLGKVGNTFFGQQLFSSGERLIITEGEIDCLTISQLYGGTEMVVSIPNGVSGAKRVFEQNLKWLENFKEIVVCFDNDEAGRKGIKSIKGVLPLERLKVVQLTLFKDPNEYYINDKGKLLMEAIENAKKYRPDDIINGDELWEDLLNEPEASQGYSLRWNIEANKMIQGLRKGEMVVLTAGTGVGKSTFVREIMYDLAMRHGLKVGVLMLEENILRTAKGILSIHTGKRLHISRKTLTDEEYKKAFDETLGTGKFFLYNHFGSLESNNLLSTIRYMAVTEKVDFIVLDHISIAVSGIEGDNERKLIDILMTKLRSICEETGVGLVVISHLRRMDKSQKSHEEGGLVSLSDLRGSQSLSQLPDTVIALERNQQDNDNTAKNTIKIRILKCRFTGETGLGGKLYFDKEHNRLTDDIPQYDNDDDNDENIAEF